MSQATGRLTCFGTIASTVVVLIALPLGARDHLTDDVLSTKTVSVYRALPKAVPRELVPRFTASPSDAEIFRAAVFEEPLVPIGTTSAAENRALARQLLRYVESGGGENLAPLEQFLAAYPSTPWRASILSNVGLVYRRTGHLSKALAAWEESWHLAKASTEARSRAVADRSLGDYADLLARLGQAEALAALLAEASGRNVGGSAAERISNARDALSWMMTRPESAFRCGPLALDRVLASLQKHYAAPKALQDFPSTSRGTSLAQVAKLAMIAGRPMQMAKRTSGSPAATPAVIHWKSGHFAALLREEDGAYLIDDPSLGGPTWLSLQAFEAEASGYAIVGSGPLPAGWRAVSEGEGSAVWGSGYTTLNNPQNYKPCDVRTGCNGGKCSPPGMAVYDIHLMLVNLNITDEPLGYTPPLGPSVRFRATYNQREVYQPQTFNYMNLGPKWTFDSLSYIEDSANPTTPINLYVRGGGQETYANYNSGTQTYAPHKESRATVKRISVTPIRYERYLPDGSIEVFDKVHGVFPSRKVFMTASLDPQGNAITFNYDLNPPLRLTSITDSTGQVTTLSYDLSGDVLKITKVTDPYGRFATFEYVGGRLERITDGAGIQSSFEYGTADFITKLTTPYGITTFETGIGGYSGQENRDRWLQATDALTGSERVAYFPNRGNPHNLPDFDPVVPPGFTNQGLGFRNTLHWDKRAMAAMSDLPPGTFDYTKARIYHWLHDPTGKNSGILESTKSALESRVWYAYAGQPNTYNEGTHAQPSKIARVMDTGPPQIQEYTHNLKGKVCESTDPMVRRTRYTYGTDVADPECTTGSSIDLLTIEQWNGVVWEVIRTSFYNAEHEPLSVTDAASQTTSYTYLADGSGRIETIVTPARNGHDGVPLSLAERTTTYEYYPGSDPVMPWRLKKVLGPAVGITPGPSTTMTYDLKGRVKTTTDSDNYILTMDYDDLDRPTKTTYPDGTYEETTYNRLDAEGHRDRLGRWSYTYHDALRRVWQTVDPLLRTTTIGLVQLRQP